MKTRYYEIVYCDTVLTRRELSRVVSHENLLSELTDLLSRGWFRLLRINLLVRSRREVDLQVCKQMVRHLLATSKTTNY